MPGPWLYYYRSRYHSAEQQQFLSRDPIGLASGDTNPYAYVLNQPTSLVDPMGTKPRGAGDSCEINTFVAGTRVLMADGTTKPIEQIRPGDQVMAGDPEAGADAAPRAVAATIVGEGDKKLVTVQTAEAGGSVGGPVVATDGHPFWVDDDGRTDTPGGRWIDAVELRQGHWLKTSDGRLVQVTGTSAREQHARVYNLTVDELHTYYVTVGNGPVLVHNCGGGLRQVIGGLRNKANDTFVGRLVMNRPMEPWRSNRRLHRSLAGNPAQPNATIRDLLEMKNGNGAIGYKDRGKWAFGCGPLGLGLRPEGRSVHCNTCKPTRCDCAG